MEITVKIGYTPEKGVEVKVYKTKRIDFHFSQATFNTLEPGEINVISVEIKNIISIKQ